MSRVPLARIEAVVVLLAGIAAIMVSFFATLAYYLPLPLRGAAPAWVLVAQEWFIGALTFADPVSVYRFYARGFVFILLAFVIGWTALQVRRGKMTGRENIGWELARGGTIALAIGVFATFWIGAPFLGALAPVVFNFCVVGGSAVSLIGMALLVWEWARTPAIPRWMPILWGIAIVLAAVGSLWLLRHIPGGYLAGVGLAWAIMGMAWLREPSPMPVERPLENG